MAPTFNVAPIQAAVTAKNCSLATSLAEAEFFRVPSSPDLGCFRDVLAQPGMCALINEVQ